MCSIEHMNSDECSFTIHHWPALQEWDVTPHEFNGHAECFTAVDPGAPGLLGAISYCFCLAAGRPAAIVIESQSERYELHLPACNYQAGKGIGVCARPDSNREPRDYESPALTIELQAP